MAPITRYRHRSQCRVGTFRNYPYFETSLNSLCGFHHPVEQLIIKYPHHVDAIGGYYMSPAVTALAGRRFRLAQLLHRSGSPVDPQGDFNKTPLHSAAYYGDLEMV
jgi:ankyrin repeat protein